jgi:Asp-tRNA(Asn)/Glu-tRNA(Gln) amidotransferase B subunit
MQNEILEMVQAVISTAKNSYNLSYGWSEIVECWTGKEIAGELKKEKIDTKEAAIAHFAWIAKIRSEHASEIESTAW